MSHRILLVDDEPAVFEGIRRLLRGRYDLHFAASGAEAIAKLAADGAFAVVCSDMRMPGMSGTELLAEVAKRHPDCVRMMLTGNADQTTAVDAINRGQIFSFLNKPVASEALAHAFDSALRLHDLRAAEKDVLERTLAGSLRTFVEILASTNSQVFARATRVRLLCRELAGPLGANAWLLDMAAMLSPIGWATLPPELAEKLRLRRPLAPAERQLVAGLPATSARLIRNIPRLEPIADVVLYQRKGFDGSGHPADDVAGERLPYEARILKIAETLVDVMPDAPLTLEALDHLAARAAEFDPAMLVRIRALCAHRASDATPAAGAQLLALSRASALAVGDVVTDDILAADGQLVLGKGAPVTALMIERLRSFADVRGLQFPIRVRRAAANDVTATPHAASA